LACGIDATQRGRRCMLHVCSLKSSISSAVVALSIVTGFTAGGGGAFTDPHSSMVVSAPVNDGRTQQATAPMSADRRITNRWRSIIGASGKHDSVHYERTGAAPECQCALYRRYDSNAIAGRVNPGRATPPAIPSRHVRLLDRRRRTSLQQRLEDGRRVAARLVVDARI